MTAVEEINDLRKRVLKGEKISVEELSSAIAKLRTSREGVLTRAGEKKKAAVKEPKSVKATPCEVEKKPDIDLDTLF